MNVEIKKSFVKDARKLAIPQQKIVFNLIKELEVATNLEKFDIKKMVGYLKFYRLRLGNYRIGLCIENNVIFLVRISKSDEIYNVFP